MEFSSYEYIKLQIAFLFFLHECGTLVGVENSRTRKSLRELSQTNRLFCDPTFFYRQSIYFLFTIIYAISIKCKFNIR
jgi:hypothetical protein